MAVKAHTGHLGTGGIQAHSAGPLFPMMIRGVGETLQAFDGSTGREGVRYAYDMKVEGSFSEAYRKAEEDCKQWLAMEGQKDNYGNLRIEFIDKIAAMDDEALMGLTEERIHLSAMASNNGRSDYHWQVSALYAEWCKRNKGNLYNQAYNNVREECCG